MRAALRQATFLCILSLAFILPRLCAEEFAPPSPDELKLTSVPEQPGAAAVILSHEEICDDNLHYCSVYKRIKILNDSGIHKYSDVSLYSYRGYEVAEVRARTVHADGSIANFEGKPLDKTVFRGQGHRVHIRSFSLPDVSVGSIVEYRYLYQYPDNEFKSPPIWILQEELFQKHLLFRYIPNTHAFGGSTTYLYNEHGVIVGIGWTGRLPAGTVPKLTELPKTQVEVEMTNVLPFVEEDHMLPSFQLKWNLQIYYRSNESHDAWWKDEGKFWNKAVEKFVSKNDGLPAVVSEVTTPTDTPEQKAKKLYALVKKFDNYTYMPEKSLQELKTLGLQQNRGASDVLHQKGGDRDEITRLFIALARTAGVPAYAARVSDRSERVFDKSYLSTYQFDAELAVVQLDGKDVFLDPGSKYAPYGLVNWRYAGSGGIRQSGGGMVFTETPSPGYAQAITKRLLRVKLNPDGSADGTLAVLFAGLEALIRREEVSRTDDEGRKKILEDEVRSWLPGNAQVTLAKAPQWDVIESPLIAEFKISSPMAVAAGHRWMIPLDLLAVNETAMFPHSERVNHIFLNYPFRKIDDVAITLPPAMSVETLPQSEDVKLAYAVCHAERSQKGDQISSTRDLALADMAIPVSEYKQLKNFFDKVKSVDEEQAVLRGSQSAKVE